ncbi:hypothetical protein [Pseudomaricurvus hydrocarbonicus]|nr:hypothetical protein [Aestuariicella hydrocarbonica]
MFILFYGRSRRDMAVKMYTPGLQIDRQRVRIERGLAVAGSERP